MGTAELSADLCGCLPSLVAGNSFIDLSDCRAAWTKAHSCGKRICLNKLIISNKEVHDDYKWSDLVGIESNSKSKTKYLVLNYTHSIACVVFPYVSCIMKRSWTCLMEPEIQKIAAGSPTLRSMKMPVEASTPPESHPDWYTRRKRWVLVFPGLRNTLLLQILFEVWFWSNIKFIKIFCECFL